MWLLMAATWPWVCEVTQSWQLCLAVLHSPVWDHPKHRTTLSAPQRDNSVLCITSCLVARHNDFPFPEKHLPRTGQWCYGHAGKIAVHSYYTIHVYTVTYLDLFLFNLYLCSSVDLGEFIQVYVSQNQSLCSASEKGVRSWAGVLNTTWLLREMTWQELKHQTYRKCLLWNSRDSTVPLVFWNALI